MEDWQQKVNAASRSLGHHVLTLPSALRETLGFTHTQTVLPSSSLASRDGSDGEREVMTVAVVVGAAQTGETARATVLHAQSAVWDLLTQQAMKR